MNKYYIELQKYNELGALTNEFTHDTAETPQGAMDKYSKYDKMRYTTTDEEGKVIVGMKMYKVTLKQGVYQEVENLDEFVRVNQIEYHK